MGEYSTVCTMIITYYQLSVFFLIFARFLGLVTTAPFFTMKGMFAMSKVALVFWSAVLIMFVVTLPPTLPTTLMGYGLALLLELAIGLLIGFTASVLMSAVEFGGALMDTQAGLSSASLLDPTSGKNAALLELLMKYVSVMLFLLLNGHHMVLSAVFESFSVLPVGTSVDFSEGAEFIVSLGAHIFSLGFMIAAPIILVIFLVDFSFGILNKVAEQINVFQLGFQVKPSVSVLIILGIAPVFVMIIISLIERIMSDVSRVLGFLIGG